MNQNLQFWSTALDGIRETDGFQPEYRRVSLDEAVRAEETYLLPMSTSAALSKFSKEKLQNLFIVLSTGVAAVVSKYCFSEKIVYAVPLLLSQCSGKMKNRFVLCVNKITPQVKFSELVKQCGAFYQEALQHQNVAEDVLVGTLELKSSIEKPLIKTLMLMEHIHDVQCLDKLQPDTAFFFAVEGGQIRLTLHYNASLYSKARINEIAAHLLRFYELVATQPEMLLNEADVISDEEHLQLEHFQGKVVPLGEHDNVLTAFCSSVQKFGDKTALVENGESISYAELDTISDQIAGFIHHYCNDPQYVGVYMKNGIKHIAAILGTIKAGAAYVPIDHDLPFERIKSITDDISLSLIISLEEHIPFLNRLQNECECMKHYLCLDTDDVRVLEPQGGNNLSDRELWEFVGNRSTDSIEGGGWQNSYTGENLSVAEMDEYGENVRIKLMPYLRKDRTVLEVGCASGITMFRIAPYVKSYYGTDLAQSILDKDMEMIREKQFDNIILFQKSALEIDTIPEKGFDIIIINSVIQCFNGYNYFRKVFEKLIRLTSDQAVIFIGDVMDAEKKTALIDSLRSFAASSSGKGYTTKTDWSQELFFSRTYFNDLRADFPEISNLEFSDKIGTIRNELTDFRFDAMFFIDKKAKNTPIIKSLGQFGSNILDNCEQYFQNKTLTEQDPAYVIYTSGTTGKPKGIEIMHGSLMRFCHWSIRFYGITERDVTTRYARVGFDAAVWELFPALCAGSEIHIIPEEIRLDLTSLNKYYEQHHVTFTFLPTQVFEQFMEIDNHSLRIVATGGDKLSIVRPQAYKIVNNYGPTEATIIATSGEVQAGTVNIPIGRPIDNTRIHILDRCGLPQPIGTIGEICIAGQNLARRYVNLPEITRQRFCSGKGCGEEIIYHSGDLGRWLPDGNIEFYGRIDGQIKISAFRIEMEEISTTLCEMSCISQAIVRAFHDDDNSKFLCAYIVTDSDNITVDEIRRYLHSKLPEYMIPSYFFLMKQFPVTPNGKTDYEKLPNPHNSEYERDIALPESDMERALLASFRKVLDIEKIGVTDSFFEIGGNSIKAIKLVAELTQHFEVTINDVFTYQTVRALAGHITSKYKNLESKFSLVKEALKPISGTDPITLYQEKYDAYLCTVTQIHPDLHFDPNKYTSVFFTGATGFLGINFLKKMLSETSVQIYPIIRGANCSEALDRLLHKWEHQFGCAMPDDYLARIHVITGELTADQFGLTDDVYHEIAQVTDCIVNAAANVHHYGHREEFSGINAELIRKLGEFAQYGRRKDLHHVSTIGIAEGVISDTPFFIFTEDDVDVGQIVTNYYTETKIQAERYAQEARRRGVHVNIYRVGNLIANSETGIFQENIDTNGFYKILRAMIYMKVIPDVSVRMLDFSFIDQVSDAMLRLVFSNDGENRNYHLFNPHQVSMKELSGLFNSAGVKLKLLSADMFLEKLQTNYDSPQFGDYIKEFILHARLFSIPDETHFTLICNRTCETLKKLGFVWKKPNAQIIQKMVNHCVQTGFLAWNNEEV